MKGPQAELEMGGFHVAAGEGDGEAPGPPPAFQCLRRTDTHGGRDRDE